MRARPLLAAISVLAVLAVLAACSALKGEQELKDDCPAAGTACPACTSDDDCVIASNACNPAAACTSKKRSPQLGVTQIGCDSEYDVPPASRCGCVASVCRSR